MLHLAQYDQALAALTELNAARPDPAILNNIGIAQLRKASAGGPNTAPSFFRQATEADTADADLFFNLGYAYWLQKDLPNAVHALREAVRRNAADKRPGRPILHGGETDRRWIVASGHPGATDREQEAFLRSGSGLPGGPALGRSAEDRAVFDGENGAFPLSMCPSVRGR